MNIKLDNLLIRLGEEYNMTYEAAMLKYKLEQKLKDEKGNTILETTDDKYMRRRLA